MKRERLFRSIWTVGDNDGMSGVIATCTACADVDVCSQDIDQFAFAFVAPLSP